MAKKSTDNARGKAGAGRGTQRILRNSQQAATAATGQTAQKQPSTVSRRGKASKPNTSRDTPGRKAAGWHAFYPNPRQSLSLDNLAAAACLS